MRVLGIIGVLAAVFWILPAIGDAFDVKEPHTIAKGDFWFLWLAIYIIGMAIQNIIRKLGEIKDVVDNIAGDVYDMRNGRMR